MLIINDFISLLFPKVCSACGKGLYKNEFCICTSCLYQLPVSNYHLTEDNPVAKLFWGRVNIYSAASYYLFVKGGKIQHLIHQLKYHKQKEIGVTIGQLYGKELLKSDLFQNIDIIIPVPLHSKKLKKRGYNQSALFAIGLSETMKIEARTDILLKINDAATQTKKSRFSRWKNIESVFRVSDQEQLKNKHILLVDDVVTTGATLEACAQQIIQITGAKVSVATIAFAESRYN